MNDNIPEGYQAEYKRQYDEEVKEESEVVELGSLPEEETEEE